MRKIYTFLKNATRPYCLGGAIGRRVGVKIWYSVSLHFWRSHTKKGSKKGFWTFIKKEEAWDFAIFMANSFSFSEFPSTVLCLKFLMQWNSLKAAYFTTVKKMPPAVLSSSSKIGHRRAHFDLPSHFPLQINRLSPAIFLALIAAAVQSPSPHPGVMSPSSSDFGLISFSFLRFAGDWLSHLQTQTKVMTVGYLERCEDYLFGFSFFCIYLGKIT